MAMDKHSMTLPVNEGPAGCTDQAVVLPGGLLGIYKSILDYVQDFVSFVDCEYRYHAVSRAYSEFFGLAEEDIVGKYVWELHGRERFEQTLKPHLDHTLSTGIVGQYQAELKSPGGEVRRVESLFVPCRDHTGRIKGVIVRARDITRAWEAEQELKKETELSRLIIDSTPDFVFFKDPEGVYLRCNKAFQKFLELPEADIVGRSDQDLMSAESARFIREKDQQVFMTMQPCSNEEWVTYNNSRRRLLQMTKVPVISGDGCISGLLGIGRDITRQRADEKKRLQAELLFEVTSEPCLILDADGVIRAANPPSHGVFGYDNGGLVSLPVEYLLHQPPGKPSLSQLLTAENWKGELIGVHRSGESRPYLVTINTLISGQGEVESYVVKLLDVGEVSGFNQALQHKAYHDPLTGLPNRWLMKSRLEHAITQARQSDDYIAVLFVDLDGFKQVNDRYGHSAGDDLLQQVARRLKQPLRHSDTLARLGGDEFVILLERLEHIDGVAAVVDKLLTSISDSAYQCDGRQVRLAASVGIAVFPDHAVSAEELVKKADRAMYSAKTRGAAGYCFYEAGTGPEAETP